MLLPLLLAGGNLAATGSAWAQTADATAITSSGAIASGVAGASSTAKQSQSQLAAGGMAVGNETINSTQAAANLAQGVPNTYASPLVAAGNDVCLGSLTGGGSGAGFGVTLGMTLEDKSCQLRSYARSLAILGYPAAAREEICQDPSVRAAMVAAGTPCVADRASWSPMALADTSTKVSQADTAAPGRQVASVGAPNPAAPVNQQAAATDPVDPADLVDTYLPDAAASDSGGNCHQEYQVFHGWQKVCK